MKKAPFGLILFLLIGLFTGLSHSMPQERNSRMEDKWKTKRANVIEDDAIIVQGADQSSSDSKGKGQKAISKLNRAVNIKKRGIVCVDKDGQKVDCPEENGAENPVFRPLDKKRSGMNVR